MGEAVSSTAILARNLKRLKAWRALTNAEFGTWQAMPIMAGESSARLETLDRIAAALGVHPSDLIDEEFDPGWYGPKVPPKERANVRGLRREKRQKRPPEPGMTMSAAEWDEYAGWYFAQPEVIADRARNSGVRS